MPDISFDRNYYSRGTVGVVKQMAMSLRMYIKVSEDGLALYSVSPSKYIAYQKILSDISFDRDYYSKGTAGVVKTISNNLHREVRQEVAMIKCIQSN